MRIRIDGNHVPKPISRLEHLNLPEKCKNLSSVSMHIIYHCVAAIAVASNLQAGGYADITPIQMQVIPAALYRRDLLACAATGSGKSRSKKSKKEFDSNFPLPSAVVSSPYHSSPGARAGRCATPPAGGEWYADTPKGLDPVSDERASDADRGTGQAADAR